MTTTRVIVLDRLERVRQTAQTQWEAACPVHDDRVQSLSVGLNDRGDWLLDCKAGCATNDIRITLDLEWGDLFADGGTGGPLRLRDIQPSPVAQTSRRRDVTTREYTGALPPRPSVDYWTRQRHVVADRLRDVRAWSQGTLERFEIGWDGERVTWPIYNADGHLTNLGRYLPGGKPKMRALPGRPRELFPAPEHLDTDVIWLVEGEPDAISMFELGIPAVGVPGVGTWQHGWAARFRGHRVVACFDCDTPGRDAAKARAAALIANGVQAWPVDMDPGRDDGFDISDALLIATREQRRSDLLAFLGGLQREALS